jgi:hypothetical protein
MNTNRNSTHFTVHRAESVEPSVGRSQSSNYFWVTFKGSEMEATLHFDSLASIITWTQTLTNSAVAIMAEVVAEQTAAENGEVIELVTQAIRHA